MSLEERKQLIIDALQQVDAARAGDPSHEEGKMGASRNKVCHCKHCKTYEELTKQLIEVNSKLKNKRKMKRYERLKEEMAGMDIGEQAHYLQLKRVDRDDIIKHFGISQSMVSQNTPDVIRKERAEDERKIFDAWVRGITASDEEIRKLELNKEIGASSLAWRFKAFDKKYGGRDKMNRKLVEQGYKEGLTPAEIAEKHGVEYQTVYYHYKNVETEEKASEESVVETETKSKEKPKTETGQLMDGNKINKAPKEKEVEVKPSESDDTLQRVLKHFGYVINESANEKIREYAAEGDYESVRSVASLMIDIKESDK